MVCDDDIKPLQRQKVCVIGAGMRSGDVGGQWRYDPMTDGADPLGAAAAPVKVHGSMYASLRLISARETMGFTDFQFAPKDGRDVRRFPGHREVYLYLKDFCDAFGLMELVRLNTGVVRVALAPGPIPTRQWMVRVPEPFRDEVVVVVGCGASGKDIAMEVRRVAKEVHLVAKSMEEVTQELAKVLSKYSASLHLQLHVERLCEDGRVVFGDGSSILADTIIYCTGFNYSFPFLDTEGAVTVDDNCVGPLFEHVFPPSLAPSLSFVGIPVKVFAPWFFEAQAKWVAQVLSGKRTLPPEEEMVRSVEEYYRAREAAGAPKNYTHDVSLFDTTALTTTHNLHDNRTISDVPVESTHMHVFTLNNLMPRLHSQSRENFSQIMGKRSNYQIRFIFLSDEFFVITKKYHKISFPGLINFCNNEATINYWMK
uniref:Flavin-containing monooxygenase n=1 Tax=Aegilops tauschii TaxID=37682 RepID=N1QTX5_AEGTA